MKTIATIFFTLLLLFFSCASHEEKAQEHQPKKSSVFDTLDYYQTTQNPLPAELYKDIFNRELSDIDTAKIIEVKRKIYNYTPVIELFSTIHADQKEDAKILNIFNENGTLLLTYSLKYKVDYDLFEQDYTFENDSIITISQKHGLNYENQDHVLKTLKLQLKPKIILDTLSIQIDTIIDFQKP